MFVISEKKFNKSGNAYIRQCLARARLNNDDFLVDDDRFSTVGRLSSSFLINGNKMVFFEIRGKLTETSGASSMSSSSPSESGTAASIASRSASTVGAEAAFLGFFLGRSGQRNMKEGLKPKLTLVLVFLTASLASSSSVRCLSAVATTVAFSRATLFWRCCFIRALQSRT